VAAPGWGGLGGLFEQRERHTGPAQAGAHRQPGRPGADDEHRVVDHRHAWNFAWGYLLRRIVTTIQSTTGPVW